MPINYPNSQIRNGKYLAGRLRCISNSIPMADTGWKLALNMKATCGFCPVKFPALEFSTLTTHGIHQGGVTTHCWAPPQGSQFARSQHKAWNFAFLTSSRWYWYSGYHALKPTVLGYRMANGNLTKLPSDSNSVVLVQILCLYCSPSLLFKDNYQLLSSEKWIL